MKSRGLGDVYKRQILPSDPRRTVRALEVMDLTGQPFTASQPQRGESPRWGTHMIGLAVDVDWLDPLLLRRTQQMFADGLVEEARALCDEGLREGVTAARAIGYSQALDVIDHRLSVEEAVESTFVACLLYTSDAADDLLTV